MMVVLLGHLFVMTLPGHAVHASMASAVVHDEPAATHATSESHQPNPEHCFYEPGVMAHRVSVAPAVVTVSVAPLPPAEASWCVSTFVVERAIGPPPADVQAVLQVFLN